MNRNNDAAANPGRNAATRPLAWLVALALAAAAVTLGVRLGTERDRNSALQLRVDRLESENSALLAQLQRRAGADRPGAGGARRPETLRPSLPTDPASATRTAAPPQAEPRLAAEGDREATPQASGPRSRAAERANALQDPAARDAMRRQQAAAMRRMYPDLAEALGISRDAADRFIDALVEQQMRKIDASARLAASDSSRNAEEMKVAGQRLAAAGRDGDQGLAAQFGDDVLQAWKNYQQGQGARLELRDLQLELVDAGMALTPAQRDALVAAMAREQATGTKVLSGEARMQQAEASYQRLQAAARAVLSAEQFARFDARQRQRLEVMMATGARGGPSP